MEKRLRTNLFLATAIVALGSLVWISPDGDKQEKTFALFGADEPITRIHVLHTGELQLALQRLQEGWQVLEPVNLPADSFQVDALLDSLRETTSRRYAVVDANLQELGLAKPEWSLDVDGEEIFAGGSTAIGNQRYVMKNGYIYLLSDVLNYRLQRSPWDYISKRVLPDGRLAALSLPDGTRIERDGPAWKIVPEDAGRTSDELQRIVIAWENAAAIRVAPAASVPRDGEVQVEFADGRQLKFGVELRDNELLLSRDAPAVTYVLPNTAAAELFVQTGEAE